jgi:hypothetical protein
MTDAVSLEAPRLTDVDYGQLNPDIHRAVDRTLSMHGETSFRVDGIDHTGLETIRDVFGSAKGERLPRYHYDEQGNYIHAGTTAMVEERHSRIAVLDHLTEPNGLWLRVPLYNQVQPETSAPPESQPLTKKELLALGGLGVASWAADVVGVATDKPALVVAGALIAGGTVIRTARRLFTTKEHEQVV